jgi:superfamily I DNA/RNA helicase/RecB family exonuclease
LKVLEHERGSLLVTGVPGTGKTAVLRDRLSRMIGRGLDPERVALVVRTAQTRRETRRLLLSGVRSSLAGVRVLTVHGLANHVMTARYGELGYEQPPTVLTAADQFSKVRELLVGEERRDWPAYGSMLELRGFADQVRQLLLRAQEALLTPEQMLVRSEEAGLSGWRELAAFYRRYLLVLDDLGQVDFAGLVNQAAAAARLGDPLFDHLMVDDYQEATVALERLVVEMGAASLVVAGDPGSHVFSFQGTTVGPIERFLDLLPTAQLVRLETQHRSPAPIVEAWFASHTSEEHAIVARELRRIHVEEAIPWRDLAVVVRRQGGHLDGLLRALDDARIPRALPEGGLSLLADPATQPFVLALRWLGRPLERDGLVESMLTSDLATLSPAAARGLVRSARAAGEAPSAALDREDGLWPGDIEAIHALRAVLARAAPLAERSVLDAFAELWRGLPYSRGLVEAAEASEEARRDLDAILSFSNAVSRAGLSADPSVEAFLQGLEAGGEGPGLSGFPGQEDAQAVRVLTAHGTAGLEFDTVVVVGVVEGNFPSLSRPEPMFDLAMLDRPMSQSDRNRVRLEDERRLFSVVTTRARRRVVLSASDPHGEETVLTARSRFVAERGAHWRAAPAGPFDDPLTVTEGEAVWRRRLADSRAPSVERLAALDGILALGVDPARWWFQRAWTDTGRLLHEHVRVSYSKLSKLENCDLQFVLSEELGLESRSGYHAWVGHLVHRLIEDCERGRVPRDLESLVVEAERRWREQEFPSHAVSEAFRRLVTGRMLPAWAAEYGDSPAVETERRFEFDFEGAQVAGAIDRIGSVKPRGTQITDYKTGKSRNAEKADENLQLGIYYLAVNRAPEFEDFRPVRGVELVFLRDQDWHTGAIQRASRGFTAAVEMEYAELMAERLGDLIRRIRELQVTGIYRPNPSANCRFCEFKPLCPLWPEGKELFPAPQSEPSVTVGSPPPLEVRA